MEALHKRPKGKQQVVDKFDELKEVRKSKEARKLFNKFHLVPSIDPAHQCVSCGGDKPPFRTLHHFHPCPCQKVEEAEEEISTGGRNYGNVLLPSSINFWTDRQLRDKGKSLVSSGDDGLAIVPEDLSVVQKRGRRDRGDLGAQQRRRRQADAADRKIADVSKKEWKMLKADLAMVERRMGGGG